MRMDLDTAIKLNINDRDLFVRLDGMTVERPIEADEENGFVIVLDVDQYVVGMPAIPKKVLHGKVEIFMGDRKT